MHTDVLRFAAIDPAGLERLLQRWGLQLRVVAAGDDIPGSFWGEEEAGLIADSLYVRPDTPVHSALHEACHFIFISKEQGNIMAKQAAAAPAVKAGPIQRLRTFYSEVTTELGKVTWPSWDDLRVSTHVTMLMLLIMAVIIFGYDQVFQRVVILLLKLAS